MFQNKGFTLVEMIFVLAIIISLTFITLPFYQPQTVSNDIEIIKYNISSIINSAKANSHIYHEKTNLVFTKHSLYYQNSKNIISYKLPKQCYFSNIKEIYFNENGNINQANHIILNCKDKTIRLIFHLGNGDYYFEE